MKRLFFVLILIPLHVVAQRARVSWIDDDFDLSSVNRIIDVCNSLSISIDFALVPTYVDSLNEYIFTQKQISYIHQLSERGHCFEIHPYHSGWYNSQSSNIYMGETYIEQQIVKTKNVFEKYHIEHSNCIVYPGSSHTNKKIVSIARNYFDYGIASNGTYNLIDEENSDVYQRLFIQLSTDKPKSYYKQMIDDGVREGAWIIIGTHSWQFDDRNSVPDETTMSIVNLSEIIEYANSLSKIEHIRDVFEDRCKIYFLDRSVCRFYP